MLHALDAQHADVGPDAKVQGAQGRGAASGLARARAQGTRAPSIDRARRSAGDQHYHQNRCQHEFFSNLAYGRPPTVQPKATSNAGIRNADHYWRVVKDQPGHDNWKLFSPAKTNERGARYSTQQSNTVHEVYGRKSKSPLFAAAVGGGRPRSPFNFTSPTAYISSPSGSRPHSPYF